MEFENIIGYQYVKNDLAHLKELLENRKMLLGHSVDVPRSFLLHGYPNLGKKFMADEFVKELGCDSFTLTPADDYASREEDFDRWVSGASSGDIRILCIHEIDRIAEEGNKNGRKMLLHILDCDPGRKDLFVIATSDTDKSRLPDELFHDRLFREDVCVEYPEREDTKAICDHLIAEKGLRLEVDGNDIPAAFEDLNYSEINDYLDAAASRAFLSDQGDKSCTISLETFKDILLEKEYNYHGTVETDENEIRRRAFHEAGHILVELACSETIEWASVNPGSTGKFTGCVHADLNDCKNPFNKAASLLAGRACEILTYGKETGGAHEDVQRAFKRISRNIGAYGGKGLSLVTIERFHDSSEAKTERQEEAVHVMMEEANMKAMHLICLNYGTVEALAGALAEKKCLLSSEIRAIIREHPIRV